MKVWRLKDGVFWHIYTKDNFISFRLIKLGIYFFIRNKMKISTNKILLSCLLSTTITGVSANENVSLDALSVTATKIATGTKEVSQSIAVVDQKTIEDKINYGFQAILQRKPSSRETREFSEMLKKMDSKDNHKDIAWVLLNSHEFLFIR